MVERYFKRFISLQFNANAIRVISVPHKCSYFIERRIATLLRQLCSVLRVIAQRHTSSTCAELCCSGSRLGFQAAINKLALPTGTVTLVADPVARSQASQNYIHQ